MTELRGESEAQRFDTILLGFPQTSSLSATREPGGWRLGGPFINQIKERI